MATYEDKLTLAAFNAATEGRGNTKLVWGTYTGTGESGEEHPNTLTFDGTPLYIEIISQTGSNDDHFRLYYGRGSAIAKFGTVVPSNTATWSGTGVTWHAGTANYQMNNTAQYLYFALIDT